MPEPRRRPRQADEAEEDKNSGLCDSGVRHGRRNRTARQPGIQFWKKKPYEEMLSK